MKESGNRLNLSDTKINKNNSPSDKEGEIKEPDPKPRSRMSNKERARKARQRKKKYYEDLEARVGYLEELCKKLTKELQFHKHKVRLYECTNRGGEKEELNRDIRVIDNLIEKARQIN